MVALSVVQIYPIPRLLCCGLLCHISFTRTGSHGNEGKYLDVIWYVFILRWSPYIFRKQSVLLHPYHNKSTFNSEIANACQSAELVSVPKWKQWIWWLEIHLITRTRYGYWRVLNAGPHISGPELWNHHQQEQCSIQNKAYCLGGFWLLTILTSFSLIRRHFPKRVTRFSEISLALHFEFVCLREEQSYWYLCNFK